MREREAERAASATSRHVSGGRLVAKKVAKNVGKKRHLENC